MHFVLLKNHSIRIRLSALKHIPKCSAEPEEFKSHMAVRETHS